METMRRLKKRLTIMMMTSMLIITGCHAKEQDTLKQKDTNRNISHGIELSLNNDSMDTEEIKPEIIEIAKDVLPEFEEIVEEETLSFYDTIDLSNYSGCSLVDALFLNGYPTTVEFRAELAHYVGFAEYDKSAYQNTAILNYFRKGAVLDLENANEVTTNLNEKTPVKEDIPEIIENTTETSPSGVEDNDEKDHGHSNSSKPNEDEKKPESPSKPSESEKPGNSGDSNQPDQPNKPENPDKPVEPGEPTTPVDPDQPNKPENPDKPVDPGKPGEPTIPTDPDQPEQPTEPDKPNEEHKHKLNTKTLYNKNNNDTHTEITITSCSECDYYDKREQEKGCSYDKVIDFDDTKEIRECVCANTKEKEHTLSSRVNADGIKTIFCTNPGCSYEKQEEKLHTDHDYTILTETTDKIEIWKCSYPNCEETKEVSHVLDAGVIQPDGRPLYSCTNNGCNYTYVPEHVHTSETSEPIFSNTADVCYTQITKCSECGKELDVIEVPHPSFHIIEEGIFDCVYGCDTLNCPYEYVESKDLSSVSSNTLEGEMEESTLEETGMSRTLKLDENE